VTIVSGGKAELGSPVWVVGFAEEAKGGPVLLAGNLVATCEGAPSWGAAAGKPQVMSGVFEVRHHPPLPVGPNGERSAGAEGTELVLTGCKAPPQGDDGLLAAEKALFAALKARDTEGLAALVAPEFVLRMPGQPDVERAAFLEATKGIPGEILSVEGEDVRAFRSGDTGIVMGTQVAKVRIDGKELEDRGHFLDVFVRREGKWVMTLALNVSQQ
jgi:ketosteroid isomerase-like protein